MIHLLLELTTITIRLRCLIFLRFKI
jgi:hypothetical protein